MFFFFKQKTAYEMRISDWSSDVCSSDLQYPMASHGSAHHGDGFTGRSRCRSEITIASWAATGATRRRAQRFPGSDSKETIMTIAKPNMHPFILATCSAAPQLGSAPCRARVCQYV